VNTQIFQISNTFPRTTIFKVSLYLMPLRTQYKFGRWTFTDGFVSFFPPWCVCMCVCVGIAKQTYRSSSFLRKFLLFIFLSFLLCSFLLAIFLFVVVVVVVVVRFDRRLINRSSSSSCCCITWLRRRHLRRRHFMLFRLCDMCVCVCVQHTPKANVSTTTYAHTELLALRVHARTRRCFERTFIHFG